MLIEGDVVRIGEKADANGVTMMNQHAIKMKSDVQEEEEVAIIFCYQSAFANQPPPDTCLRLSLYVSIHPESLVIHRSL